MFDANASTKCDEYERERFGAMWGHGILLGGRLILPALIDWDAGKFKRLATGLTDAP
jgi:hypothetical protein